MAKPQAKTKKQKTPEPTRKKRKPWKLLAIPVILIVAYVGHTGFLLVRGLLSQQDTFGKVSFDRQMPIPELAKSKVVNGTRTFDLTMQTGETEIFNGAKTKTWGVNGDFLGPTLRAKRGEKVRINLNNTLPETTSVHWHGMHLPAQMDGGPHQLIEQGKTWSPNWQIDQPAATLWYHPHPHGQTEKHVYRGIAGMFILDDDNEAAQKLPHEYGKDDFPVIVQDKKFNQNKQFDEGAVLISSTGNIGNEILVNGARTPHVNVANRLVRLRLLNGSTARMYNFGMSDDREMRLIASDGGLLNEPVVMKRVLLSPGERAEVVVELKPGEQVNLRSYPSDMRGGSLQNRLIGSGDKLEILQLRAADKLFDSPDIPKKLAQVEQTPESSSTETRKFQLTGNSINGKTMDMKRVDFQTKKSVIEVWEVTNRDGGPHNFHIHGVSFQVLEYEGAAPPPEMMGWKDTILIRTGQKARLIMKMPGSTDSRFPFMFHCHLLRHEDQGMMGQFLVGGPEHVSVKSLEMNHSEH